MIKIKTVITALANPTLHEKLKETNKYNLPIKDIQYQDGLIEYLKDNLKIDTLIISEILPGSIDKKAFIQKIKSLNYEIKVIVILEKEEKEFINFLRFNNICRYFLDSKVDLNEIINAIDKNEEEKYISIPKELLEEINYLKQEINKKNKIFDRVKIILNKLRKYLVQKNKREMTELIKLKKLKKYKTAFIEKNKIISIFGTQGSRKVNFCFNVSVYYRKRT